MSDTFKNLNDDELASLCDKLDELENSAYQEGKELDDEVEAVGIKVKELIELNTLMHQQVGSEYESWYNGRFSE